MEEIKETVEKEKKVDMSVQNASNINENKVDPENDITQLNEQPIVMEPSEETPLLGGEPDISRGNRLLSIVLSTGTAITWASFRSALLKMGIPSLSSPFLLIPLFSAAGPFSLDMHEDPKIISELKASFSKEKIKKNKATLSLIVIGGATDLVISFNLTRRIASELFPESMVFPVMLLGSVFCVTKSIQFCIMEGRQFYHFTRSCLSFRSYMPEKMSSLKRYALRGITNLPLLTSSAVGMALATVELYSFLNWVFSYLFPQNDLLAIYLPLVLLPAPAVNYAMHYVAQFGIPFKLFVARLIWRRTGHYKANQKELGHLLWPDNITQRQQVLLVLAFIFLIAPSLGMSFFTGYSATMNVYTLLTQSFPGMSFRTLYMPFLISRYVNGVFSSAATAILNGKATTNWIVRNTNFDYRRYASQLIEKIKSEDVAIEKKGFKIGLVSALISTLNCGALLVSRSMIAPQMNSPFSHFVYNLLSGASNMVASYAANTLLLDEHPDHKGLKKYIIFAKVSIATAISVVVFPTAEVVMLAVVDKVEKEDLFTRDLVASMLIAFGSPVFELAGIKMLRMMKYAAKRTYRFFGPDEQGHPLATVEPQKKSEDLEAHRQALASTASTAPERTRFITDCNII